MKKWNLLHKIKNKKLNLKNKDLINVLLQNRGIKSEKEKAEFLNPSISKVTTNSVLINKTQLAKALKRIRRAIGKKEKIIVFGDYDVDGICGAAILWETLNNLKADALPYIPSRFEEGYGLSIKGIDNLLVQNPQVKLIITVDNGIVANDAVDYANKNGIDVIITDHHVPSKKLPSAFAIVHTTLLCGAGVAYLLSKEIKNKKLNLKSDDKHLELVVLATIADLVPLKAANRTLVKFGLAKLRQAKRPGLLALCNKAGINIKDVGVYEIGHIIAPRLNAMGRLENAMESLRLICTTNPLKAQTLANVLSATNLQRQELTIDTLIHAKKKAKKNLKNLIFIADESYEQGIIGLVAGRLVEEFYLPSIVIAKGKIYSKASARSVKGFNIIEFLREASDLMVDIGGHPMAAGFTIETKKLELLEERIYALSEKLINKKHLQRVLNIDLELPEDLINIDTYNTIQKLAPFGMANPEPIFLTRGLIIQNLRTVGNDGKHLKIQFTIHNSQFAIEAIAFGLGEDSKLKTGDKIDVVYILDENEWNGNKSLQLKIKDIKIPLQ